MESKANTNQVNVKSEKVLDRLSVPNIVLVGGTASGKSSVGFQLARILDLGVLDLDAQIEKEAKKSIPTIFKEEGEAGFRARETRAVQGIKPIRNHVVVTGGGAIESEENWQILKSLGPVVWLATPNSEITRRLLSSHSALESRPILKDALSISDPKERERFIQGKLDEILERRIHRYKEADFILSCSYVTVDTCARFMKSMLLQKDIQDSQDRH